MHCVTLGTHNFDPTNCITPYDLIGLGTTSDLVMMCLLITYYNVKHIKLQTWNLSGHLNS